MAKPTYFYAKMCMASGTEHLVYVDGHALENDAPSRGDYEHACLIADKILADGEMSDWWHNEPYGPTIGTHTGDGIPGPRINRHQVESYTIITQDT